VSRILLVIGLVWCWIVSSPAESGSLNTRVADGFDFPIGPPNADGYYKSRGFNLHGHLGEDWVSEDGSGAIFGHPVYAIGTGVVTLARDFLRAWGNVVVIRHAFLENGQIKWIDSLYAHLNKISVSEGQAVSRGDQIGTVGNAHGLYPAHLHFEVHNDLTIGVVHAPSTRLAGNYMDPSGFVDLHRTLKVTSRLQPVTLSYTMPTFAGIIAHPGQNDRTASIAWVGRHRH
jgi:murein DD-endopeptidase MepM/ murein hydrolase activator NlpD